MAACVPADVLYHIRKAADFRTWRAFDLADPDGRRQSLTFTCAFRTRLQRLLCLVSQRGWSVHMASYLLTQEGLQDRFQEANIAANLHDPKAIGLFEAKDELREREICATAMEVEAFLTPHARRAWDMGWEVSLAIYAPECEVAVYTSPGFALSYASAAFESVEPDPNAFEHRLREMVFYITSEYDANQLVGARYSDVFVLRVELGRSGEALTSFNFRRGAQEVIGSMDTCIDLCMGFYHEVETMHEREIRPILYIRQGVHYDGEEIAWFDPPNYNLSGVYKLLE